MHGPPLSAQGLAPLPSPRPTTLHPLNQWCFTLAPQFVSPNPHDVVDLSPLYYLYLFLTNLPDYIRWSVRKPCPKPHSIYTHRNLPVIPRFEIITQSTTTPTVCVSDQTQRDYS